MAQSVVQELEDEARLELLKLRKPPPRLNVQVTGQQLRENPDNVVRLRIKVTEEGLEWNTIESEGVQKERLVAE